MTFVEALGNRAAGPSGLQFCGSPAMVDQNMPKGNRNMRDMSLQVLPVVLLVVAGGCVKRGPAPPAQTPREQAIIKAVSDFKQELVALARQYPDLAGVENFPFTSLGFTFVNNSVSPRIHIAVPVEDEWNGAGPSWPVGGERIPGTKFVTALQLECADAELKKKIEDAYSHLKDRLKTVK